MAFDVNTRPLSALTSVKFTYNYNTEEKLQNTFNAHRGGFEYYDYELFKNFKDAALSKKNCLVLTDVKDLQSIFEQKPEELSLGTIAGTLFLKASNGKYLTTRNKQVYVGGVGQKLFLNIVPIEKNVVELKANRTTFLQIDEQYPYTVRLTENILDESQSSVRRFEVDYKDNQISFKVKTSEGYRFLSYGVDFTLRAVGVELNETLVNPYRFTIEPISDPSIEYNFDPTTSEIKYYNELLAFQARQTVDIKTNTEKNTNLLVTCPTFQITASAAEVNLNIALMKTNFSSSGTYSSKV
jgi:hypothetical protein